MKSYADLTTLKSASYLNITGTTEDTAMRKMLEAATVEIDKFCHRFFHCQEGTRYYDGDRSKLFPGDDILSVTTLKVDADGNGVWEATYAVTDYHLMPFNSYPKTWLEIASGGSYQDFGGNIKKAVEIAGVIGYGDGLSATPYYDSGGTTNEALDASELGVDVSSGALFAVGQTIRVENEQMYIQSISTNTLTVRRGVNGTIAATHDTGKAVYIYEYPAPISEACALIAMRAYKLMVNAGQRAEGSPETGVTYLTKSFDVDIVNRLAPYIKVVKGKMH